MEKVRQTSESGVRGNQRPARDVWGRPLLPGDTPGSALPPPGPGWPLPLRGAHRGHRHGSLPGPWDPRGTPMKGPQQGQEVCGGGRGREKRGKAIQQGSEGICRGEFWNARAGGRGEKSGKSRPPVPGEPAVIADRRATPSGRPGGRFPPQRPARSGGSGSAGCSVQAEPGPGAHLRGAPPARRSRSAGVPVLPRTPAGRPQTRARSVAEQGGLVFALPVSETPSRASHSPASAVRPCAPTPRAGGPPSELARGSRLPIVDAKPSARLATRSRKFCWRNEPWILS